MGATKTVIPKKQRWYEKTDGTWYSTAPKKTGAGDVFLINIIKVGAIPGNVVSQHHSL